MLAAVAAAALVDLDASPLTVAVVQLWQCSNCRRTWTVREDGWIAGHHAAYDRDHMTRSYCSCGRLICVATHTVAAPPAPVAIAS